MSFTVRHDVVLIFIKFFLKSMIVLSNESYVLVYQVSFWIHAIVNTKLYIAIVFLVKLEKGGQR